MLIKWESGYEIKRPFGYKMKGLHKSGKRPSEILIFLDELGSIDMRYFIMYVGKELGWCKSIKIEPRIHYD